MCGCASVTLSGLNFGESDLTATVDVILTLCETVSWFSMSGLVCSAARGAGMGTLLSVRVTAAALVGSATELFTYDCVE